MAKCHSVLSAIMSPSLAGIMAALSGPALAGQPVVVNADFAAQLRQDVATVAAHNSGEQLLALWRLGLGGPPAGADLAVLREALGDDDWRVVWLAERALAPACKTPLPPEEHSEPAPLSEIRKTARWLTWKLDDAVPEVRKAAGHILFALGPDALDLYAYSDNAKSLVQGLWDPDPEVAVVVQQILAQQLTSRTGQARENWVRLLLNEMTKADKAAGYYAASRLLEAQDRNGFTPALISLQRECDRLYRMSTSIKQIFKLSAAESEPLLIKVLGDPDRPDRAQAAEALAALGPRAAAAVPQLAQALSDPDLNVAQEAYYALEALGPAAAPAAPELVKLIESNRVLAGEDVIRFLGRFGGAADVDTVLALLRCAADSRNSPALESIKALAPAVYDAYRSQIEAAANTSYYDKHKSTAKEDWAAVLAQPSLRGRVAKLLKQQPGAPGWPVVTADSTTQEKQAFFNCWIAHTYVDCPQLKFILPGLPAISEPGLAALWQAYNFASPSVGWEAKPEWGLPAIARALAARDKEAYNKFLALSGDTDARKRRLGLYGLSYCWPAPTGLAPEMMAKLRTSEVEPYERALCARVLTASKSAGPYAAELLELLQKAYADAWEISPAELVAYGNEYRYWHIEDQVTVLRQSYDMLATELLNAIVSCGPSAYSLLLAKAHEKTDSGRPAQTDGYPPRPTAAALTSRAALRAIGMLGPTVVEAKKAYYPAALPQLPEPVEMAVQWLIQCEALGDRVAAAETLGRLYCADERVIKALLNAAKDIKVEQPEIPAQPGDWRAAVAVPEPPLRDAAIQALKRLSGRIEDVPRV